MTSKPAKLGLGRAELARHFGVAARTVDGWRENGCPRHADGTYDVQAIEAWRATRLIKNGRTRGQAAQGSIAERIQMEELLTKTAKRIQEEIAAKQAEGRVVALEDIERERVARILEIKQSLESLGARVVPQLKGLSTEEQVDVIDEHVRSILETFARSGTTRRKIKRGPGRPAHVG